MPRFGRCFRGSAPLCHPILAYKPLLAWRPLNAQMQTAGSRSPIPEHGAQQDGRSAPTRSAQQVRRSARAGSPSQSTMAIGSARAKRHLRRNRLRAAEEDSGARRSALSVSPEGRRPSTPRLPFVHHVATESRGFIVAGIVAVVVLQLGWIICSTITFISTGQVLPKVPDLEVYGQTVLSWCALAASWCALVGPAHSARLLPCRTRLSALPSQDGNVRCEYARAKSQFCCDFALAYSVAHSHDASTNYNDELDAVEILEIARILFENHSCTLCS